VKLALTRVIVAHWAAAMASAGDACCLMAGGFGGSGRERLRL
jgi:hypothetical protein